MVISLESVIHTIDIAFNRFNIGAKLNRALYRTCILVEHKYE